jgi:guanylate kinase
VNKIKVIALVGKSGSGKDTIAKRLVENDDRFYLVVTSTTRPKRDYEKDGVDYHFITTEEFLSADMVEKASFNTWYYGTSYDNLDKDKYNVIVINPEGLMKLEQDSRISLETTYLVKTSDKERLMRQLSRENNPNVKEIVRRFSTDESDFEYFDKRRKVINYNVYELDNNSPQDLESNINLIKANIR